MRRKVNAARIQAERVVSTLRVPVHVSIPPAPRLFFTSIRSCMHSVTSGCGHSLTFSRIIERRFRNRHAMRGRAQARCNTAHNPLPALDRMNLGKPTPLSAEDRRCFATHVEHPCGTRVCVSNVFSSGRGGTLYLSNKELNREMHSKVGNTLRATFSLAVGTQRWATRHRQLEHVMFVDWKI